MISTEVLPWLDPEALISGFGPFALVGVCLIVFAETGLLVGFLFPGDTLLVITGLLTFGGVIDLPIIWVALVIGAAAFIGGEVGYFIGNRAGPRVFERKESGFFSVENVKRTNAFFAKYGGIAVILARFVPVVRTFAPVAAGVGHMDRRKYTFYNLVGAMLWGVGLTLLGWVVGFFDPVANFVRNYIEAIILTAIGIALLPAIFHYIQGAVKARKSRGAPAVAEDLALKPKDFDQDLTD